ncbi:methyltransferase [Acinetobacter sp. ANC 5054]|uniref:O-methyltransferase n=1 Tax=Acinetobacter sp. ANC 5054 TaxID=1977877 RepID=UPI000A3546E0|nr:O-methyltransferase [Acinetobacter sp. ANC 5054]OTG82025.1 methyltransferase [Acinetobacter sp. ANC 5054]
MSLDAAFLNYMQKLYADFTAHDAQQNDRLSRYRNIEPESALLLAMQIRMKQAKRILEIGTSTGYSTLWLADAAQSTQGIVETIEIDQSRIEQAKEHAAKLGLSGFIQFNQGDALQFLQDCSTQYDFILLDAERDAYVEYWTHLPQLLSRKGGVLFVDNVLSHAQDVVEFIRVVKADPRFVSTTINVGAGLLMVTWRD